jgi:hypothetical protein
MGIKGTVYSFVSIGSNRYHGYAVVPGVGKRVFLPDGDAHMALDPEKGTLRKFRDGEERKHPITGTPVTLELQNGTREPAASKWAVGHADVA